MKDSPIIFSGPNVRSVLAGTKTQDRRVIKLQHDWQIGERDDGSLWPWHPDYVTGGESDGLAQCLYGRPGDRLWVRETFKPIASGQIKDGYGKVRYGYAYAADGATVWAPRETVIHDLTGQPPTGPMQFQDREWKRSIHMPRRASRILLEITDVRVQRLQDISADDCIAEGIRCEDTDFGRLYFGPDAGANDWTRDPCEAFRELWEPINGAGSWRPDTWVWAITFKRVQP